MNRHDYSFPPARVPALLPPAVPRFSPQRAAARRAACTPRPRDRRADRAVAEVEGRAGENCGHRCAQFPCRCWYLGKHASRDASGRLSPVPTVPEGPGESGEAVAQAAALVGLGATSVYQAKAVIDRAPELAKQVESGKISVDKAHKIMKRDGTPPDPNARSQPREKRIEDIRRLANEGNRAFSRHAPTARPLRAILACMHRRIGGDRHRPATRGKG